MVGAGTVISQRIMDSSGTLPRYQRIEVAFSPKLPDGTVSTEGAADGWELVSSVPLIAPNRDGVAYGTVGCQMILKRSKQTQ